MADGGSDIADDDALRSSIAKTLLEIDELQLVTELENLEANARMTAAEAAKRQEEKLKAEEQERRMQEEERNLGPGEA